MGMLDRVRRLGRSLAITTRSPLVTIDDRKLGLVPGAGVAVYETQGRLVLRVVDASDGLGIERDENHVVERFDSLTAESLGEMVVSLGQQAREVDRPTSFPKLSEYAASLIAAAPTRHRSYRSWQRVTRYVSISLAGRVVCARMHADLSRGAWTGAAGDDAGEFAQQIELASPTTSAQIGAAVLQLLVEPPRAG